MMDLRPTPAEVLSCWVYLLVKAKEEMLSLPTLADYRSQGDHGKPYVPRWGRRSSRSRRTMAGSRGRASRTTT